MNKLTTRCVLTTHVSHSYHSFRESGGRGLTSIPNSGWLEIDMHEQHSQYLPPHVASKIEAHVSKLRPRMAHLPYLRVFRGPECKFFNCGVNFFVLGHDTFEDTVRKCAVADNHFWSVYGKKSVCVDVGYAVRIVEKTHYRGRNFASVHRCWCL